MDQLNYKQLLQQGKRYLVAQINYSKLTAAEKVSLLLSRIALVAVLLLIGSSMLLYLSAALVMVLTGWLGSFWVACVVVALILLVFMLLLVVNRRRLIVDPVTRFITRLFLSPEEPVSSDGPQQPTPPTQS